MSKNIYVIMKKKEKEKVMQLVESLNQAAIS